MVAWVGEYVIGAVVAVAAPIIGAYVIRWLFKHRHEFKTKPKDFQYIGDDPENKEVY